METTLNYNLRADISTSLDPTSLYLLIFPTENCNFRCTYCYEDHNPVNMQPKIVEAIKKLLARRMDDTQHIQLSWFGGEPLLGTEIVFELCEFVQSRCQQTGTEQLVGEMTTNGYLLTESVMKRLTEANQKHFHISLDGIARTHDSTRPLVSGKGTFDRIWNNLTTLRASQLDFDIVLRLHFGVADIAETEALCRKVDNHFAGDHRFNVLLQGIKDLGGENGKKITPLPRDERMRIARHLFGLFSNVKVSNPDTAEEGICYAAKPNHLIIRADGSISKCAVNLRDPRNTVGRLDESGYLHIDKERFNPWLKGFEQLDSKLLTCPYTGVLNIPFLQHDQMVALKKKASLTAAPG